MLELVGCEIHHTFDQRAEGAGAAHLQALFDPLLD
jgi:hypothetical protein